MSTNQVINAFDLLGQGAEAPEAVRLAHGSAPALEIAWGEFRQSLWSSLRAALAWMPKRSLSNSFSGSLVEPGFPSRALVAAALWHLVFLVMPSPRQKRTPSITLSSPGRVPSRTCRFSPRTPARQNPLRAANPLNPSLP